MASDLMFEYFYEEARGLLDDISRLAWDLRTVDIPDDEELKKFADCVQKLHRLIGGMASVGFSMFASVSHKTSIMAERGGSCRGISIQKAVTAIYIIVADLSSYFTSVARLKEVEMIASKTEKRIDEFMSIFHMNAVSISSQSEIDDIMKMFGKV